MLDQRQVLVTINRDEMPRHRLEDTLKAMNDEGHLTSAVLTTIDGLPVAAAPSSQDPEAVSAMAALLKEVVNRVISQVHLAQVEEVSLIDHTGMRMVCRYFYHSGQEFILTIVAPPDQPYRRMVTQSVRAIRAALSG